MSPSDTSLSATQGAASAPSEQRIGTPGQEVRAFAFAGGGFDTAMQLGVAHALLVSRRQAPDVVVGISAGAVNAVTLAEILQAGQNLPDPQARLAQITLFRKFLNEYQEAPGALLRSILPDAYEVNFNQGLRPVELPIHSPRERRERARAFRARAGLIHLLNGFLRIGVSFGAVTRAVRRIFAVIAAAEIRNARARARAKFTAVWGLWWLACKNLHKVTPQAQIMAKRILKHWLFRGRLETFSYARDAGQIIFGRVWRAVWSLIFWWGYYILTLLLWLVLGVALFAAYVKWLFGFDDLRAWLRKRLPCRQSPPASRRQSIWQKVLQTYELDKDLGDAHFVRQLFVRLFDPSYYGTRKMEDIIDHALEHNSVKATTENGYAPRGHAFGRAEDVKPFFLGVSPQNNAEEQGRKRLSHYLQNSPPIRVAPLAANVATGELEALPQATSVVDGLMAATAVVPLFRAVHLGHTTYIDGLNVSNEPALALLTILREAVHPLVSGISIYPVTPFPLHENGLAKSHIAYTNLVDVALRAMQLRRYRDATLEREIVELYGKLIAANRPVEPIKGGKYVAATIHPIEVDQPLELNDRILSSSSEDERRRLILHAVADGCRATLEAILQSEIAKVADKRRSTRPIEFVGCRAVIGPHTLPGLEPDDGPGVPEVCRECAVFRAARRKRRRSLRVRLERTAWPAWPQSGAASAPATCLPTTTTASAAPGSGADSQEAEKRQKQKIANRARELAAARAKSHPELEDWRKAEQQLQVWPRTREICGELFSGDRRPMVTFLFSGGVFRGVFQIGVLNALNQLGLHPDIIAGASVGSITAALSAQVFSQGDERQRTGLILQLAATFMALDRLILTDRFADFVRRFTLRAAETQFSPRDADEVFRRYDAGGSHRFNKRLRRVVAGLERLFYISPYELDLLVKACRMRQPAQVRDLLRAYSHEFLERHGVGLELLGAEPLALLIREYVLSVHGISPQTRSEGLSFDVFESEGIKLLATVTNLRDGKLDILGQSGEGTFLEDGLLASSAFPSVFRPRLSWEMHRGARAESRFIDGGVMDNLPLNAVVKVMEEAGGRIARRPIPHGVAVPHLLFAGSLEVNVPDLSPGQAEDIAGSWLKLWRRSRQISYNRKIDVFAQAHRDLRALYEHLIAKGAVPKHVPLNVELVAVKPEWLCGTFAMHPMLGFRRAKQAASIAHGCAATLARFARTEPTWTKAWGIPQDRLAGLDDTVADHNKATDHITLTPKRGKEGHCWFRAGIPCPFSAGELAKSSLSEIKRTELLQIYEACGRVETHRPAGFSG